MEEWGRGATKGAGCGRPISRTAARPPALRCPQDTYEESPNGEEGRALPYKGGVFRVQLDFTDTYPNEPPKVRGWWTATGDALNAGGTRGQPPLTLAPPPPPPSRRSTL